MPITLVANIPPLNQERGVTVILTTHDMDDVEALCTPVMVIGHGRILSDGNLEDLRARLTTKRLPWWWRRAAYPFPCRGCIGTNRSCGYFGHLPVVCADIRPDLFYSKLTDMTGRRPALSVGRKPRLLRNVDWGFIQIDV